MHNNNSGARGLRPPPDSRTSQDRAPSNASQRSTSSLSSANEDDFNNNSIGILKRGPYGQQSAARPSTSGSAAPSSGSINLQNFSRPAPRGGSIDSGSYRGVNPTMSQASIGHRPRQHSQGFFEPSLPHASQSNSLSASQIAAAAAMSHIGTPHGFSHERKRSVTGLAPINTSAARRAPSPIVVSPPTASTASLSSASYTNNGGRFAATSAANAAYPKSPMASPNPISASGSTSPPSMQPPTLPDSRPVIKEKSSKMKLFSKPKSIGISKNTDMKPPPLPSPNKGVFRPSLATASTTSLVEPSMSSASSLYSTANASTSTLVPATATAASFLEREKEKHRPHFLSSRKNKTDNRNLPLSSASSNSQAVDPSAPQSLYSFTPQSPGPQSSFSKSMSGLDLRHGGRALREKKKEEKAAASLSLTQVLSNSSVHTPNDHRGEFLGPAGLGGEAIFGPPSSTSTVFANDHSATAFSNLGSNMGLSGMTPDDAWPLLKARLLNIFEGEDLRTPIEDFNLLVSVHIRRCVQKRAPVVLVEDLRELLFTGFSSLAQTLRNLPDDRLVPNLVEIWHMVYCTILPFVQAVFLPLDLEFRGHGSIMTSEQAADFWGTLPDVGKSDERPSSLGGTLRLPSLGEELDVRRTTLIIFRDTVITPRHDQLLTIFSRLSLDTINATPSEQMQARSRGASNPTLPGAERPGTGGSLSPRLSSFNSQASTLLDAASSSSGGNFSTSYGRSRAASNTSAGSFGTSLPHTYTFGHGTSGGSPNHAGLAAPFSPPSPLPTSATAMGHGHARSRSNISLGGGGGEGPAFPMRDPAQVTETVARMLQCVSVLAGVQTGDQGQAVVERLTGALKWNWLGRGRTGRQRKGFVGMRVGQMAGPGKMGSVAA